MSAKVPVLGSRCHCTAGAGVEVEVLVNEAGTPEHTAVSLGFVATVMVFVSPTWYLPKAARPVAWVVVEVLVPAVVVDQVEPSTLRVTKLAVAAPPSTSPATNVKVG